MTELLLPYLPQLGLAGLLFLLLMAVAQLGLTQFCRSVLKKWSVELQGGAVMGLSLAIGAVLGGLMLSKVAVLLEIRAPEPWGGVFAGMVLAATVSGVVSYLQQRSDEKLKHQSEGLAAVLAQMAGPGVAAPQPAPAPTPQPASPEPAFPSDEPLRPITPEEAAAYTRTDWPDVAGVPPDDAPLVRD